MFSFVGAFESARQDGDIRSVKFVKRGDKKASIAVDSGNNGVFLFRVVVVNESKMRRRGGVLSSHGFSFVAAV